MRIIFARHGNTFAPGDRVVWIGAGDDVPLVAKGRKQARRVAQALAAARVAPERIFCASLRRTREHAEIIARELGLDAAPVADRRLNEIDYGTWAGRTSAELAERPGLEAQIKAWSEADVWPRDAGWDSSEAEIRRAAADFMNDITGEYHEHEVLLVVTSNGVLRFFPRSVGLVRTEAAERKSFQMKTGHVGVMACRKERFSLACWNVPPEAIVL